MLAAGAAVGRTADEAAAGGARSSFRQPFRLGRPASLGGERRHGQERASIQRSASLGAGAPGAVGPPHPYARVTELVQALQRGYGPGAGGRGHRGDGGGSPPPGVPPLSVWWLT